MLTQIFQLLIVVPIAIVLEAVFSLLPDINFLSNSLSPIAAAFEWFFGLMAALDPIFPYTTQLIILNIIIGYYVLLFTFRLVSWVLRKIPFIGIS